MNAFDLAETFASGSLERANFLSRLFGMFSEEPVRTWGEMDSSPYEYLGRPTIYPVGGSGHTTLDFAFRRRADGLCFVAEMKCEIAFDGFRYMTLNTAQQVNRHLEEQRKAGKHSFPRFVEAATNPKAFVCRATTRDDRKVEVELAGSILVWGRFTDEGRVATMSEFGFADVLAVEAIVNDLIQNTSTQYNSFLDQRTRWCQELFANLGAPSMTEYLRRSLKPSR